MREHKNFWDRNAGLYDCFMRKDRAVYEKMYELIRRSEERRVGKECRL